MPKSSGSPFLARFSCSFHTDLLALRQLKIKFKAIALAKGKGDKPEYKVRGPA